MAECINLDNELQEGLLVYIISLVYQQTYVGIPMKYLVDVGGKYGYTEEYVMDSLHKLIGKKLLKYHTGVYYTESKAKVDTLAEVMVTEILIDTDYYEAVVKDCEEQLKEKQEQEETKKTQK